MESKGGLNHSKLWTFFKTFPFFYIYVYFVYFWGYFQAGYPPPFECVSNICDSPSTPVLFQMLLFC